jgi:HSP20 family molecular chaperone IbpA
MNTGKLSDYRNRLMASFAAVPACQIPDQDTDWFPAVDVTEAEEEYLVEVDLPGLKPEEIKLSVDNDALSISGERLPLHHGGRRLRVERPSGAFVRRLPLPQDACGEIYATLGNGLLELRVPRTHPHNEARQAQAVALEPPITRSSIAACGSSGCEAKPALQTTIAETQSKPINQ